MDRASPETNAGIEVPSVGIDEDHDLAPRDSPEGAPHRVALAHSRPPLGQELVLLDAPPRPRRPATSPVPSADAASTTSTWSTSPSRARIRSTIDPTVSATSRAGSTTESRALLRSISSWSGKSARSKARVTPRVLWRTGGHYPHGDALGGVAGARRGRAVGGPLARAGTDSAPRASARGAAPRPPRRARGRGSRVPVAHQADALGLGAEGHTIVTTGTASGKSLAFNLPVLDTLCRDPPHARSTCTPPRRWPRTRRARCTAWAWLRCGPRSTTATPRARSGAPSGSAPT